MVIALDLDKFGDLTRKMGWTEYSPNPVTRYLSHAVADFAEIHQATILYGLDVERGTEEAQLYCSHPDMDAIVTDLETMRREIRNLSETTLSVGIAHITPDVPVKALKDFHLAKKALKESKRKGRIVVL
ncbi:MAG: hypothetical protein HXS41_11870 [Theionarchaea archaeon]|nr:hypothetical protein [Theionarchaea archaeon]MBU7001291.1 hypothetical protein [Theionarchaea archaeon]MBU7021747.1 hypothetical protein [Theionarchaea archaeon]MBU7034512.1 hypothetical protein [Theionarchaea archaeon]MBU7040999.1 hypothetical protein [Theionarchaea archaeon]